MTQQGSIAVIGAGIVGAAIAWALAREGRSVLLLDRAEPGVAGASFGNVGHIAAELVQPLPSPALLFGFWRQLSACGGVLDLPAREVPRMAGWIRRFAAAAFRRGVNTGALSPLVRPAASDWARYLAELGRDDLLKRHGHYEVDFGAGAARTLAVQAAALRPLGVATEPVPGLALEALRQAAGAAQVAGLWYPDSAHVLDPLECVRALVGGARARGAEVRRFDVQRIAARGAEFELEGPAGRLGASQVIVCAGVEAGALLAPLGIRAPLRAARGYHLEVPDGPAFLDAPVVYTGAHLVVTPMSGRVRASTFMEFRPPGAPADPRKTELLRRKIRELGYGEAHGPAWVGSRPVLPDYLPGLGRAADLPGLYYAVGHQHIGLTLAPVTADLVADLVAGRRPRHPVEAFDLKRFG